MGSRFAFGPFVLDPGAGTLLRSDDPVAVGHRGVKLLAALVRRPGEILRKAELMDAAWPGRAVEEGNLTVQIAQLRKLLGPAADGGEWIATVPRVGYRFTGAINHLGGVKRTPLPLPDKPSIAVLPFVNISNDPEQESFADGLTEDLITDLSRMPGLFVIARNSAFSYKGRAMDVRAIAEELGVRYLLEGSARRAAGQVRINAQLVDAVSGDHLWAERFDRSLDDIFAVQDEVTGKIVEALLGRLRAPPRNRPKNLEAYDLCVRARRLMDDSPQTAREAHLMLTRAISLDPDYAEAYRWLAINHWMGEVHSGGPTQPTRSLALELARKAVAIDPNDAGCRWILAYLLAYERSFDEADAEFAKAIELDPNEADTFAALSDIAVLAGRIGEGREHIAKAFRLNPFPASWYYLTLGQAQYAAGEYESAVETLRRDETYRTSSRRFLAASLAQLGRLDEARAEVELFLVANPHFSTRHWAATEPFRDARTLAHFIDGYRKAGLPE
jgi:TolB-like protein